MATTLTIGMAHHNDFDGVFFTAQAIRLAHPEILGRTELLVVDNSPGGEAGRTLRSLVEDRMGKFFRAARYVPMPEKGGTSQTRNRVFAESDTDAVLCMDCHVLIAPGSLASLLDYYDSHPESSDLLAGPLLTDQPGIAWTHFDNQWRGHMWGTWGVAWQCTGCGAVFSPVQHGDMGDMTEFRSLAGDGSQVVTSCNCRPLPELLWVGHEAVMKGAGFAPIMDVSLDPFDVPAQGLGLFTCRKAAWLGFNEQFRGFGGEEFYIHEKYRQAGRSNLCLPWLQWLHRFARPGGPKYRLRVEDRVRNYVIGHQELNLDLAPLHDHFTTSGVSEDTWQAILADPIGYGQGNKHAGGGCGSCRASIAPMSLEDTYAYYAGKQSDFNEHFPKLRELAAQCGHVTEFGSRDYGVIPLLAGLSASPAESKTLRSYNSAVDGAAFWKVESLEKTAGVKVLITHEPQGDVDDIEETDLLFYDPAKSDLFGDLERHGGKIRRYIVVHDTDIYGVKLPDGQPGLKLHLIQFMRAHPEWTVVYSTSQQYGLMVLSKDPADKPKRPSYFQMGPTFLKHLGQHVADGMKSVKKEQLEARLEECWLCDLRTKDSQCSLCGCPLLEKASWRSSRCDANKWAEIDAKFSEPESA